MKQHLTYKKNASWPHKKTKVLHADTWMLTLHMFGRKIPSILSSASSAVMITEQSCNGRLSFTEYTDIFVIC